MIGFLLTIIGIVLLTTTGLGYIVLCYILMGLLELTLFLFSSFVGFIVLGLIIAYGMSLFNKHS